MIYAYFCANLFGGMFKKTRSNRKELETGFECITGAFPVTFLAPRATSRTKEGSKTSKVDSIARATGPFSCYGYCIQT